MVVELAIGRDRGPTCSKPLFAVLQLLGRKYCKLLHDEERTGRFHVRTSRPALKKEHVNPARSRAGHSHDSSLNGSKRPRCNLTDLTWAMSCGRQTAYENTPGGPGMIAARGEVGSRVRPLSPRASLDETWPFAGMLRPVKRSPHPMHAWTMAGLGGLEAETVLMLGLSLGYIIGVGDYCIFLMGQYYLQGLATRGRLSKKEAQKAQC